MKLCRGTNSESVDAPPVVLIVDDHTMLADALGRALNSRGFLCSVADLGSAESVAEQAARIAPDLVLLDLDLGAVDGLDLVPVLRASGCRVLLVTSCEDRRRLAAGVAAGAVGWIAKARPFEELLDAAQSAYRDRPLLAAERLHSLSAAGRESAQSDRHTGMKVATLTPREREVLDAMVRGDSARDMAESFVVSIGTIRSHIASVLLKLGVSSQLAAVAVAVGWAASRRGLDREDLLAPLSTSA